MAMNLFISKKQDNVESTCRHGGVGCLPISKCRTYPAQLIAQATALENEMELSGVKLSGTICGLTCCQSVGRRAKFRLLDPLQTACPRLSTSATGRGRTVLQRFRVPHASKNRVAHFDSACCTLTMARTDR